METPRAAGLSPTLRQMMILVLAATTICAGLVGSYREGLLGPTPDMVCLSLAFMLGVWPIPWMVILFFFLDRPGPIRNWYLSSLMAGGGFLTAAAFLTADPASYVVAGRTTLVFPLLTITGVICFVATIFAIQPVRPCRCLSCGRRSVIRVFTRLEPPRIRHDTGWCATCGAGYERVKMGEWKAVES